MPSTLNTTVRARIDHNVKVKAEAVLKSIGMETSDAIRLLLNQIATRQEFPLELRVPNSVTIAAMNAEAEPEVYESSDALFEAIFEKETVKEDVQDKVKKSVQERP